MLVPSEAVPFVYLASVCQSLQCLISALTQAGWGGLLFRFADSVLLWGGRGAAGRYRCVWVALAVFQPHWVCPHSRVCAFPVYTAQVPGCPIWSGPCIVCSSSLWVIPQKRALGCTCVLCLPRPEQPRPPGAWRSHSPWVQCTLSPSWSQPQFPCTSVGCMRLVSILRSWPLAATLPADVNHPESQEVFG